VFNDAIDGFVADFTERQIEALAEDPAVEYVAEDVQFRVSAPTTQSGLSQTVSDGQWGLDVLDDRTFTGDQTYVYDESGTGVDAYVFDTGIRKSHSEFTRLGLTTGTWDVCSNTALASAVGCYVSNYATAAGSDQNGHGTHVAAILGGTVSGVAKNVRIIPVQVLGSNGSGYLSDIITGVNWAVSHHPAGKAAVANLSLGVCAVSPCPLDSQGKETKISSTSRILLESALTSLMNEGVVTVAAAGNSGEDACKYVPASTSGTISVGATWKSGSQLAETSWSNYGECVDIFSPGGQIRSADWASDTGFKVMSGTSMAAPYVSGAAAIFLQRSPTASTTAVWESIRDNATYCEVAYYATSRTKQTPNRMLHIGSGIGRTCPPKTISVSNTGGNATVTWTAPEYSNGAVPTSYTISFTPSAGVGTCTYSAPTLSCTATGGITSGTTYTASVKAVNSAGDSQPLSVSFVGAGPPVSGEYVVGVISSMPSEPAGANPVTVTAVPDTTTTTSTTTTIATTTTLAPADVPLSATLSAGNGTLKVSWVPATTATTDYSYVVTLAETGKMCTSTTTSCTFTGLKNGSFATPKIETYRSEVKSSTVIQLPRTLIGITIRANAMKVKSTAALTKFVSSVSRGARSYKVVSGKCRIVRTSLVTPSTTGTCGVRVTIAKYKTFPRMSTTFTVTLLR
jgi:subtilisin family serine protease